MERKRPASQSAQPSVTDASQSTTQKRAKLTLKPPHFLTASKTKQSQSFDSFLEHLLELETSEEVLEQMLWFIDVCIAAGPQPTVVNSIDECVGTLGKLWKDYNEDLPVCDVLIHLFVRLVNAVDGVLSENVEEFALSLVKHADDEVKVSALKCLQRICGSFSNEFKTKVLEVALREIHSTYHKIRVDCVNLIGRLSHVTGNPEDSLVILEERCCDADPRVRNASFQSLTTLHSEGLPLPISVYSKASDCLADDSEDVRTSALRVVWKMGLKYRDKVIPLKEETSVEIRLLDDSFVKVCNLVNDSSVSIRALAAGLLGDFNSVSAEFLSQTLDKKLMSHLRVVKSEHERQRDLHKGGASMDWETGRKWAAGAPKIDIDPGEISLMNAGACGAFVHGLEDEFMEVRSAAIDSMCRLGVNNPQFASQCLDYLVDMFNDEIQSVRLKAISSLGLITATMVLRDDQLETVLGILDETSSEIRDALRSLLATCQIMTRGGLNTTVHALLDNLKKYPTDRQSIWRCLKQLGSHHGTLVSTLVPELLSTHPFFMGKEPDVDDPAYICILILVFNAAAHCPTIPPLFPNHVFRHYTYLRDTLPDLIPHIRTGVPAVVKLGRSRHGRGGQSGSKLFLAQVLSRAHSAANICSPKEQQEVWHSCITDLQRVKTLDKEVTSSASCAAIFIQCQLLINKVSDVLLQDVLLTTEGHQSISPLLGNIRELLLLGYRLEYSFTKLNSELLLRAKMVRATAHAMSVLLAAQMDLDTENSDSFTSMKLCLQERVKSIQRFCESTKRCLPSVLTPIAQMDLVTIATENFIHLLQPLLKEQFCTNLPLPDLQVVRQTHGELLEPQSVSCDDYTKFVSSLALSVHVEALLSDVNLWESVAVQARFPDGQRLLFPVKPSQIRDIGRNELKLDTSVVLSHGVWTDPSQVEFCIVMRYKTDISEDNCFPFPSSSLQNASPNTSKKPSSSLHRHTHTSTQQDHTKARMKLVEGPCSGHVSANPVHSHPEDGLVESRSVLVISDTVKVNIHPQEKASKSFGAFLDPVNRL